MADTGKQSPLGQNVIGSYLLNKGLTINPVAASYMGASKTNATYSFGKIVNETCLRPLTWAINDGYLRGPGNSNTTLTDTTYNNLISIGSGVINALGNSKPPTYVAEDPSGVWTNESVASGARQGVTIGGGNPPYPGPATSGYGNYDTTSLPAYVDSLQGTGVVDQKQNATWIPYDTTNPNKSVTQWGYVRLHALQAWNEFNWNGDSVTRAHPDYKEFLSSFLTSASFIAYNNQVIMAQQNARTFLDGSYSNMDDLVSADITGVSLATQAFGQDLDNLGKVLNLKKLDAFGLPSILLQILGENNAVIQDLVLALLAAGLDSGEVSSLVSGTIPIPSKDQERKIYSAFLIIMGENLSSVLAPLQCITPGIETLADLLNVKKLFPNSYQSLTVPKYNKELGLPTNSKTYYPIYLDGGVNTALSTAEMKEYVGTQIPKGAPPIYDSVALENVSLPEKGFGTYLYGILPQDQAIAAGAFSFSMRQIRKIEQVDVKKFAKVVKATETMVGLPLTAGTSKPTNQEMLDNTKIKEALGTGPYGTYTLSDLFGCMSGLPYAWKNIHDSILKLQTTALYNLYVELFLAVTWQPVTVTPTYTSYEVDIGDGIFITYYTVTGLTITSPGGGYGRGNAPDPTVTLSNGGSGYVVVGRDNTNMGSNGSGTFGRGISVVLTNPGPDTTSIPTATVEYPPTSTLGGTNTPYATVGWQSPMNDVVQNYINLCNAEIASIASNNPEETKALSVYWNTLGSQLTVEQRTRYSAIPPVAVPKTPFLNPYSTSINVFVDSLPNLAQDTRPHMSAQTIEAITDYGVVGGQSAVGMMRQERNQVRLAEAGITLDNNIPADLSSTDVKTLTTNGTLPAGAVNNIPSPVIDYLKTTDPDVLTEVEGYTNPSWHIIEIDGEPVSPVPRGMYSPSGTTLTGTFLPANQTAVADPATGGLRIAIATTPGSIKPILNGNPTPVVGVNVPVILYSISDNPQITDQTVGNPDRSPFDDQGTPGVDRPIALPDGTFAFLDRPTGSQSFTSSLQPGQLLPVIIQPAGELDPSNTTDNLNPNYTSSTLLPSSYSVEDAIDKVVECNCECWIT